jgi:hypothetical protein
MVVFYVSESILEFVQKFALKHVLRSIVLEKNI